MYYDSSLAFDLKRYGITDPRPYLEKCGVWETYKGESEDLSLEEIFCNYYFIIKENEILYCSPDIFVDHIMEEING